MKGGSALLKRQIALITLLVGTVAIVLVAINVQRLTTVLVGRARGQADTVSLQLASAVESALVAAPDSAPSTAIDDSPATRAFAEAIVKRGVPITSLIVENASNEPLLQVPNDAAQRPYPSLDSLVQSSFPSQLRQIYGSDPVYEYTRALEYRGNHFGRVRLGISVAMVRSEITRTLIINLLIALAAIAAATFIAISSARLIVTPLRAITSSIEQIARDQVEY